MATARTFWQNRQGATAALMSIALVPIIGTLAISVEYSNAVKQKYTLQQIVDSTATALAKDSDVLLLNQAQLKSRALTYAKAVVTKTPVEGLGLDVTASEDEIKVDASGTVKLTFAKVLGQDSLIVQASVTVVRSKAKKIELALALDNTGSMAGTKINELKKAVRALADFMGDKSKNPGEVKISMVPFANYVRTNKSWMPNSIMASNPPGSWDGCVTDREQPNDVNDASPSSGGAARRHRFTRPQWVWSGWKWKEEDVAIDCNGLARIIPLTTDMATIKSAADSMISTGTTNVPIGLAWAWNSLTTTAPLTQAAAKDPNSEVVRAMIVLTDGDNTENYWGDNSGGAIDKRMAEVCKNIKTDGVVLYTVRVINGNADALRSCASSATHYYNITNAADMTPVFQQIATSLSKLRISK
jgi:Flp pilus assembly protein TadG